MKHSKRRRLLLAAGVFLSSPIAILAQQPSSARRLAVLTSTAKADPEVRAQMAALVQALQKLGWKDGRNLRIDYRYGESDAMRAPQLAKELLSADPEVIVAATTPAATAFRQLTLTIPIVFVQVPDPVAAGFVTDLARPNGNITGFTNFEFSIGGKWLQAIKECAPNVRRVGVVFDPANPSWTAYLRAVEASAESFAVQLFPLGARDALELRREIASFAKSPNGALVVLPAPATIGNREVIIALAAEHRLPAIYPYAQFAVRGGLMSYGIDLVDLYRRAASYVDQILKGSKPANLPIQQPTKFEFVVNLKTAKALGIKIPHSILQSVDRVVQ